MKKDIHIPHVEDIYIAAIQEWNDDFMQKTWYAYLVNDSEEALETVIVVSKASGLINGEERKTGMLRHAYVEVPANTAVRVEMIEDTVLRLQNTFMLTFFKGITLYEKTYIFKPGTINEENMEEVPVIFKEGILLK